MSRPRVVASVEARMGSSRLPGKVLADLVGAPAIARIFARLTRCRSLDGVVLATSLSPRDDVLAGWAEDAGIPCHRGSEEDVLGRVVAAQRSAGADVVVEICGDMPLLDPELVDRGVAAFLQGGVRVVTTTVRPSYPEGIDVQVFSLADLEWVAEHVPDPDVREHVSLYFYKHPERYPTLHLEAPEPLRRPGLRLVLDHPGDLELIRSIYARLLPEHGETFGLAEVLDLLQREPELAGPLRVDGEEATYGA